MALRGQRGLVRVEGKSWLGYFSTYTYDATTNKNIRKQRSVRLGKKSLTKFEAYRELAKHIEKSGVGPRAAQLDGRVTFKQFAESRWLPTRESRWRSFTNAKGRTVNPGRTAAVYTLGYIYKAFGNVPLERLDAVAMQVWINDLAKNRSASLVKHSRYYLKAILEWAVWEDILRKNPAKFLQLPATKSVSKSVLTPQQFRAVLKELSGMDSLLVRVAVFCAFRPSELLALRWRDFDPKARTFTVRETVYNGVLRPFSKTTDADEQNKKLLTVAIPDALAKELERFRSPKHLCSFAGCKRPEGHGIHKPEQLYGHPFTKGVRQGTEDNFIFSTPEGTPLHKENVLHRVFKPVKKKLNLPDLNFQVLRRTMATQAQEEGSMKDIQVHLRHRSPNMAAEEYVQEIPESARNMVNEVFASLNKKKKH
jgi:integrase